MPKSLEDLLYGSDSLIDSFAGLDTSHLSEEDEITDDDLANICNEEFDYD